MTRIRLFHSVNRKRLQQAATLFSAAWFLLALAIQPARAQTYTVLHYFNGADGSAPQAAVIRDAAGNLYGTTVYGSDPACYNGCGTIFKVDRAGNLTTLYSFRGSSDGYEPYEGLLRDGAGNLYGVTTYGGTGTCGNGTAACGTVFKLDPSGNLIILHTFNGGSDGATPPPGRLVADSNGNLYGATAYGGSFGFGTVYEIHRNGQETVLYSFHNSPDGNTPMAGVVLDAANRALYGITEFGDNCPYGSIFGFGCGTVYKLSRAGESALYDFNGQQDGASPNQNLVSDSAGNLYGTTEEGGDANCALPNIPGMQASARHWTNHPLMESTPPGCGTVFKIDAQTGQETVLYQFTGGADGSFPASGVVLDSAGNIYGETSGGGDVSCNPNYGGCGTVFKLDTKGNFTVLHTFTGPEGAAPEWGSLLLDASGNIYGTTSAGGTNDNGVVFKITP